MSFAPETRAGPAGVAPQREAHFAFLPTALTKKAYRLIDNYHSIRGYSALPDFLWDADTRDFIEMHGELGAIFKRASRTRSAKKSNQYYLLIATIVFSVETLVSDFAGWGTRFPGARRRALEIVGASLLPFRTRMLDRYLSPRSYIPANVIKSISPD
jgi:hypothetical protein